MVGDKRYSSAVATSADKSFPKQLPPQPTPAFKKLIPIRRSNPTPRITSVTSAPTDSHIDAISFAKLIFVARNELAAYFIISALATSVMSKGTAPARSSLTHKKAGSVKL